MKDNDNKKINMHRQGDVVIFERQGKKELQKKHDGKITVALGKVTGHSHVIECDEADWWENADGTQTVSLKKDSVIKHEEHSPISLPAGEYEIVIQREYWPKEIKKVMD